MLEVLLVIAGALLVLFGGMYIMSRIDRWIREEGFAAEEGLAGGMENVKEEDREHYDMLIFGDTKEAKEICRCAKDCRVRAVMASEVLFRKEWEDIRYIVAVSDSDLDNLLLCNIGRKLYNLKGVYGICSSQENRNLFQNSGVRIIEKRDNMGEYILSLLKGKESLV